MQTGNHYYMFTHKYIYMQTCSHFYLIYQLVVMNSCKYARNIHLLSAYLDIHQKTHFESLTLHELILTSTSPLQVLVSVIVYYGQRLLIVRCDMKEQALTRWCIPVAWVVMFRDNKIPYPGRHLEDTWNSISGHTLRRRERRLHHV